tara:strand:- start:570 stop:1145 length:576 start_codon:yes stop_codon:yes gene_type:complete
VLFIYFTNDNSQVIRDKYGNIISAVKISSNDLRGGDCFNDLNPEEIKEFFENEDSESMDVNYVKAVPCSSYHNNEVLAISQTLLDNFDTYPSEDDLSDSVFNFCAPMGFDYLGVSDVDIPDDFKDMSMDTSTLQEIENYQKLLLVQEVFPEFYVYFFPRIDSWRLGDKSVTCILYTETPRTGSVKSFFLGK